MSDDNKESKNHPDNNDPSRSKSPLTQFITSSSPTIFISFDDLMKASTSVANMTLAHEIAIDDEFKLTKAERASGANDGAGGGLEATIRATMMAAFWDVLRAQLSASPPQYGQALSLLHEVREEIKALLLLPAQERVRARIDEELDLDLIRQQLEKEAFSLRGYADFIIDMMGRLCAPVRDPDIEALRALTDPVELYQGIFRVLDLMKMDMANFTISQMRPYIQQQSVAYEKKKFHEYMEAQQKIHIDGLANTKVWLANAYNKLKENPATIGRISPNIILSTAYLELLDWDVTRPFPESSALDEARLLTMGDTIKRLLLASTLILVTGSHYSVTQGDAQALKDTLKSHCLAILADVDTRQFAEKASSLSEQIISDVTQHAQKHSVEIPADKMSTLRSTLVSAVDPTHRVHKLLKERMWEFLSQIVLSDHREPLQIPQGLNCVQNEIRQILGQLMRIMAHNRNVFGSYYDDIIQQIINK